MDLGKLFVPLAWSLLEIFLTFIFIVILFGLVAGIFTYGRPIRKRRSDVLLDDALAVGMNLSHLIIGFILGKMKGGPQKGTWLNDQEILAMLRGMSPSEFEEYVARIFTAMGYQTKVIGGSGDEGVDITMMKEKRRHLVQCKKFITRKVTPHDVRDFYGAMGDKRVDGKGFFVTTNIFTLEAERFADGKPIELIDGSRLVQLVRKSGVLGHQLQSKNAPSSQQVKRCPICDAELIVRTNSDSGERFIGCSRFPKCRFTKPL